LSGKLSFRSTDDLDPITRHNLRVESYFSAFNGIYMGLALFVAPVVAVTGLNANPIELTIIVSASPVGVFFGPLWADLGRRPTTSRPCATSCRKLSRKG